MEDQNISEEEERIIVPMSHAPPVSLKASEWRLISYCQKQIKVHENTALGKSYPHTIGAYADYQIWVRSNGSRRLVYGETYVHEKGIRLEPGYLGDESLMLGMIYAVSEEMCADQRFADEVLKKLEPVPIEEATDNYD